MRFRVLAVLAAALAFVAPLHAQSTYESEFQVTQWPPVGAPDPSATARWVDNGFAPREARVQTRDQIGFANGQPVWGPWFGDSDNEFANVQQANGVESVGAAYVPRFPRYISADGSVPETGGQISARAKWENGFEIDPGATFTFSGVAGLSIYGDAAPLQPIASIVASDMLSFASLVYADAADRVGFGLGAWLNGTGGLFSLTHNAGLVSLSITNNTAALLTGTLRVASYVNVSSIASPAPEPQTYAMLLLGLAVVGATARRRKSAPAAQR